MRSMYAEEEYALVELLAAALNRSRISRVQQLGSEQRKRERERQVRVDIVIVSVYCFFITVLCAAMLILRRWNEAGNKMKRGKESSSTLMLLTVLNR